LNCKSAILPGIGAFGEGVNRLRKLKLDECIREFVASKKMFIGVCLGFQMLFSESSEFGYHQGLNLIQGSTKKFTFSSQENLKKQYKVPHIGWNILHQEKDWNKSLLKNNLNKDFMYFVHSYYVKNVETESVIATTKYAGIKYCSAVKKDNIYGFQFHPEKSGLNGLKVYHNLRSSIQDE